MGFVREKVDGQTDLSFLLFLARAGEGKDWSLRCINGILRPGLYAN